MNIQSLKRICEAPEKGFLLAYLRREIIFEKYISIEDVKKKLNESAMVTGKDTGETDLLELHMFDENKEYRAIKTTSKRFPEGKIECIVDFKETDDCFVSETLVEKRFEKTISKIKVLNHLVYDENGAVMVDNYRLIGEV